MENEIALGVDLGWVSQLEARGVRWVDDSNNPIDPILAAKEKGANTVRLRVFVNPPDSALWTKKDGTVCMLGFADAQSVLQMSLRAKNAGMKLMIDFHYSDHFADPQYQDIPEAWKNEDINGLCEKVRQHTKYVLGLLANSGIYPEWVQVGNEINPGILLPVGDIKNSPENLALLLNAGYDAAKECCPDTKVVTHIACVHSKKWCDPFFTTFFEKGGKTDILGFSYYPYWYRMFSNANDCDLFYNPLIYYSQKYNKPVMVCEVGGPQTEAEETYNLLLNTIEAVKQVPNHQGVGVFYWEPEVGAELLPDRYPLGAALPVPEISENTLRYTKALSAYRDAFIK